MKMLRKFHSLLLNIFCVITISVEMASSAKHDTSYRQNIRAHAKKTKIFYDINADPHFNISLRIKKSTHESSCFLQNSCRNPGKTVSGLCSCDDRNCAYYLNCCYDAIPLLMPQLSDEERYNYGWEASVIFPPKSPRTGCEPINYPPLSFQLNFLWMVNDCPSKIKDRLIRELCSAGSKKITDIKYIVPFYSPTRRLIYRNFYCAICHEEDVAKLHMFHALLYQNNSSTECDIYQEIEQMKNGKFSWNCSYSFKLQNETLVDFRSFYCFPDMVSTYSLPTDPRDMNKTMFRLCTNGPYAPVVAPDGNMYRNSHCLHITNKIDNQNGQLDCVSEDNFQIYSFPGTQILINVSVLIENKKETHLRGSFNDDVSSCKPDFSSFEMGCNEIHCKFGYRFKDQKCTKFLLEIESIPVNYSVYIITRLLDSTMRITLENTFLTRLYSYCDFSKIESSNLRHFTNRRLGCEIFKVEIKQNMKWSVDTDVFKNQVDKIKDLQFHNFSSSPGPLSDIKSQPLENICQKCFVPGICSSLEPPSMHSSFPYFSELQNNDLQCPYIEIKNNQLDNIMLLKSASKDSQSDSKFRFNSKGGLDVCVDMLKILSQTYVQTPAVRTDMIDVVITYATFSISSFSLIVFLLFSLTSKKFRSTGSKVIMYLVISLLISQISFLVGIGMIEYPHLCEILGIYIHFSWLNTFTWMVICAFDMWQKFKTYINVPKENWAFFPKRFCISIIFPLLFITPLVIIHFLKLDTIKVRYGGPVCFISTFTGKILGVIVPVCCMLSTTLIFMFHFCFFISQHNRKTSDLIKIERSNFLIIVKLSTLFGFSWIAGVLAAFFNYQAFWYFFNAMTGLQGLFLSLAFSFKSKMMTKV